MKKSAVLLILLAGLVAFAVVFQSKRDKQLNSARLVGVPMREYLLPDLPVADVRKIRVREGKETTTLEAKGNQWVVEERAGYTAAFDKINRLVSILSELKITGKNEVGPSAIKELMLQAPSESAEPGTSGVQIELMNDKGDLLASMVAGGITLTTGGANSDNWMGGVEQRYVRVPKDENTVWMVKDNLTEWTGDAKAWLNKAFVSPDPAQSLVVKSKDATTSWSLERNDPNEPFTLQGKALEENVAAQLGALLSGVLFTDVHPKGQAAELLKEALEVTLHTFDGFVYDLKFAKKPMEADAQPGQETVYVSFVVNNDVPKERPVASDETPEDKKAKDEAFAAAVKAANEKLGAEKALEGWVFEIAAKSVEGLFRPKEGLLAPKDTGGGGPAGDGGLPPGMPNFSLPGLPARGGQ